MRALALALLLSLLPVAATAAPPAEALLTLQPLDPRRARSHPAPPIRVRVVRDAAGKLACGTEQVPLHDLPAGAVDFEKPFARGRVGATCESKVTWKRARAPAIEACLRPGSPISRLIERCLAI